MLPVKFVIGGNFNRQAVGVNGPGSGSAAALGGLSGCGVPGFGRQGDVVIDELAPGDESQGHGMVVISIIGVNGVRDVSGSWKWLTGNGHSAKKGLISGHQGVIAFGVLPRSADAVSIIWRNPNVMGNIGSPPERVLEVVAHSRDGPVALDLALGRPQALGTVSADKGLGGVNEGQAVGNGVLAEAVLLGQVSAGLVDDSSQVADVFELGKLALAGREADAVDGGGEGGIHSLVGDARAVRVRLRLVRAAEASGRVVKGRRTALPRNNESTAGLRVISCRERRGPMPELGGHCGG